MALRAIYMAIAAHIIDISYNHWSIHYAGLVEHMNDFFMKNSDINLKQPLANLGLTSASLQSIIMNSINNSISKSIWSGSILGSDKFMSL